MKALFTHVLRGVVLWFVLMIGQVLGGLLVFRHAPAAVVDGPFSAGLVLLIVGALDAAILTLLAAALRFRGWRLGLELAVALFTVQSLLSLIEALVFGRDVHLAVGVLVGAALASLIRSSLAGLAIAALWRRGSGVDLRPSLLSGLVWKFPLIAAIYIACYLLAGGLIAWRSTAVRAFYGGAPQFDLGTLIAVQFGRGLIWAGLTWMLVRALTPPTWRAALLVGLAFSGLMAPQLLYPNPAMPWAVRSVHLVELGLSNMVFGIFAALVMLASASSARRPVRVR
jgi:hypothetical protein